jgi:predicted DNA-binding protein (UPF0251 family)
LRLLEHAIITIDEMEAMRLSDYEGLNQEEVAQRMQVSRPTVTRMLARAHRVVADALVHGKAIRIEGGDYRLLNSLLQCPNCGHQQDVSTAGEIPQACAKCQSPDIGLRHPDKDSQET